MKRYCLLLDLKDDPNLIEEYEQHHKKVWPEIQLSVHDSGIAHMEVYRFGNRLCMIIDTSYSFSFEKKAMLDHCNSKVQEWEGLMSRYQQLIPATKPGDKWAVATKIFEL